MRPFLGLLMAACAGLSQPMSLPAFKVASVKPSPPPSGGALYINLGAESHGTARLANVTLGECGRPARIGFEYRRGRLAYSHVTTHTLAVLPLDN